MKNKRSSKGEVEETKIKIERKRQNGGK